ncbi:MAG: acetyl-CoA carboxylase biotin carboxyl carrier protein subunit [Thermoflexaceae bacterium]|nr:acetyl-CoA carboxylase biotin carboxyl carrier protein subunit [Thermoflexaceae bacterium]
MASLDVPAPMAGSIKEVLVAAGDRVAEGQEIIVLESMKMEIPVESPATGTVSEVLIAPSARIDEGQLLLRIEVG